MIDFDYHPITLSRRRSDITLSPIAVKQDFVKKNKEAYDAIADDFALSRDFRYGELPLLLPYIEKSQRILDLGCGTGRVYQFLKENQLSGEIDYIGVDNSAEQLAQARKRFPGVLFQAGSLIETSLDSASIETIFCIAAFHHLPDRDTRSQSLQEMFQVLKPGGKVLMSNWNIANDHVFDTYDVTRAIYQKIVEGEPLLVPWKHKSGEVVAERAYWYISPEDTETMAIGAGFELLEWFYTREDRKELDPKIGMNIVSILQKR